MLLMRNIFKTSGLERLLAKLETFFHKKIRKYNSLKFVPHGIAYIDNEYKCSGYIILKSFLEI